MMWLEIGNLLFSWSNGYILEIQAYLTFIAHDRCCEFYKLKARPSTSKNITTHFSVILALLWWSGIESAVCLWYAWFRLLPVNPKSWVECWYVVRHFVNINISCCGWMRKSSLDCIWGDNQVLCRIWLEFRRLLELKDWELRREGQFLWISQFYMIQKKFFRAGMMFGSVYLLRRTVYCWALSTVVGNKNILIIHLRIWYWWFSFVKHFTVCKYIYIRYAQLTYFSQQLWSSWLLSCFTAVRLTQERQSDDRPRQYSTGSAKNLKFGLSAQSSCRFGAKSPGTG